MSLGVRMRLRDRAAVLFLVVLAFIVIAIPSVASNAVMDNRLAGDLELGHTSAIFNEMVNMVRFLSYRKNIVVCNSPKDIPRSFGISQTIRLIERHGSVIEGVGIWYPSKILARNEVSLE